MKFGKLWLATLEEQYKNHYINYNYLKGKIKYSQLLPNEFIKLLTNEMDKVEKFYSNNKNILLKNFCVLNILSILKITKKYNKYSQLNIWNNVYRILYNKTFYKDLYNTDIIENYINKEPCIVCYNDNNYLLSLPCNHKICWNCCLKCYTYNMKNCPYCREIITMNPLIIKLEELTNKKCNPIYHPILIKNNKLLFIGLDGLRPDCLLYAKTPVIDELIQQSSYTFDSIINSKTVSGPSWTSIFTGKKPSFTGITMNETIEDKNFKWSSTNLFKELNKKNISTKAIVSTWLGIPNLVQDAEIVDFIDSENTIENDKQIINKTYEYLIQENINSQFIFSYLNSIDEYGHKYGFSLQSNEYIQSIEIIDSCLKNLIEKAKQDYWDIIITTDHGGCKYNDLPANYQKDFKSLDNVQSQLEKKSIGVHGLDIPQHKRAFQLYYGDKYKSKEIISPLLSTDIYNNILSIFTNLP
jgi:hypothetical protein